MSLRELVDRVSKLISSEFGLSFDEHRIDALERAVERVLKKTDLKPEELLEALARHGSVQQALLDELLVGETHFFRNPAHFKALEEEILPRLEREKGSRKLMIWSAGCSSGEEPYSIAIVVDRYGLAARGWNVRIVGTDLSLKALEKARSAVYTEWSFRDTPPEVITSYFRETERGYELIERVRRMVSFMRLNLMDLDVYPRGVDLIFCRNVLIYLKPDAAERVVEGLYSSLTPGGWLFVAPGEIVGSRFKRFELVFLDGTIVYRKPRRAVGEGIREARTETLRTLEAEEIVPPQPSQAIDESMLNEDPDTAEKILRKHIEDNPVDPKGYYMLGVLYQDRGRVMEAIRMFKKAIYLDGDLAMAHFHLANLYRRTGDLRRALKHLSIAEKLAASLPRGGEVAGSNGVKAEELLAIIRAVRRGLYVR